MKAIHLYVALAVMVATMFGFAMNIGGKLEKLTMVVDDVREVKDEIKAMATTMRNTEDRLLRVELAKRLAEQPDPPRLYVPKNRTFDD